MNYIKKQKVETLKEFYSLMNKSWVLKDSIANNYLQLESIVSRDIESLENVFLSLSEINKAGDEYLLFLDNDREIRVNLDYEIGELQKDIIFLTRGEDEFYRYLSESQSDFDKQYQTLIQGLKGINFSLFFG